MAALLNMDDLLTMASQGQQNAQNAALMPTAFGQSQANLLGTQLHNQGIPLQNQQTGLQNTAIDLLNQYNQGSLADRLSEAASHAQSAKYALPAQELEADKSKKMIDMLQSYFTPQDQSQVQSQPPQPPQQTQPSGYSPLLGLINPKILQASQDQAAPAGVDLSMLFNNQPQGQQQSQSQPAQAQPTTPKKGSYSIQDLQGMSAMDLNQVLKNDPLGFYDSMGGKNILSAKLDKAQQDMMTDLASPAWQSKISSIGTKQTNGANLFDEFRQTHPDLQLMPEVQSKLQETVFKPNAQPNMSMMLNAPVAGNILDDAAQRIADHKSTISEEINKGRFTGQRAMQVHDELVNKVADLSPEFSEQDSEAGAAFAKNPTTRKALSQMDNAYSTIGRLQKVYSGLDNTQFPTLNKAINAGKVQTGDVKAAQASIAEVLGNDELTQAFARGGMGSDKLRDMSSQLANYNLSPQQMAAQFDEVLKGVARSRAAYETQGAGYIKPMKVQAQSYAPHPQDSQAVAWAKSNPSDPRAAKILAANP